MSKIPKEVQDRIDRLEFVVAKVRESLVTRAMQARTLEEYEAKFECLIMALAHLDSLDVSTKKN